jgi:hypothetical protein
MTSITLKKHLIERISQINDLSILHALSIILDGKSEAVKLNLSSEQLSEIKSAKNEIETGLFIDEESMHIAFEKWLKEK